MRGGFLVALAGCARFDPSEPIELVPDPAWPVSDVARLEAAGECWNLAFGTQFVVTSEPTTEQAVLVSNNELACLTASGLFTPGVPARIDVCPYGLPGGFFGLIKPALFQVVLHELGHAAGIRKEGKGSDSVMGENSQADDAERGEPSPAFSSEDRALLEEAAPDFSISPVCTIRQQLVMVEDAASGARCRCIDVSRASSDRPPATPSAAPY